MFDRLADLREKRDNGEGGFTLIELLVVVVIIGILIAIAIPLYLNYKKGANDKAAQSDLRGAVTVLEQCNSDTGNYPASVTTNSASGACTNQRVNISGNTSTFVYAPATGSTPASYVLETGAGSNGSGKYFCYDSAVGGSLKTVTTLITSSATACPAA
jgi:type IV pilus assembly protein PilA